MFYSNGTLDEIIMDILNLKSNLRRKLLTLLFTNPDEKYYVRQLERRIGYSAGNISAEFKRLSRDGLFQTEKIGNILFYQLNKQHPLYSELKSIVAKTMGVEGGLKEALEPLNGIICAFIFGSFAKGEEHKLSDIDLFIIGEVDSDHLSEIIREQEKLLQREINYHHYGRADWDEKIVKQDSFILNLKKQPKIFLIGDNSCL